MDSTRHHPAGETIPCWIYHSSRKDEMYLYLAEQDLFDDLPEGLLERFGQPRLIMKLELHPGRQLAREDVTRVMANLREQGFHLQLPPKLEPHLQYGD
jgi:uncharacterized protein YcgL (UPF0745 family)